jgi:Lar family restriction alleviation protein
MEVRNELKPCPFCGGKAEMYKMTNCSNPEEDFEGYYVICSECAVQTPMECTTSAVIAAWNRRISDECI